MSPKQLESIVDASVNVRNTVFGSKVSCVAVVPEGRLGAGIDAEFLKHAGLLLVDS